MTYCTVIGHGSWFVNVFCSRLSFNCLVICPSSIYRFIYLFILICIHYHVTKFGSFLLILLPKLKLGLYCSVAGSVRSRSSSKSRSSLKSGKVINLAVRKKKEIEFFKSCRTLFIDPPFLKAFFSFSSVSPFLIWIFTDWSEP